MTGIQCFWLILSEVVPFWNYVSIVVLFLGYTHSWRKTIKWLSSGINFLVYNHFFLSRKVYTRSLNFFGANQLNSNGKLLWCGILIPFPLQKQCTCCKREWQLWHSFFTVTQHNNCVHISFPSLSQCSSSPTSAIQVSILYKHSCKLCSHTTNKCGRNKSYT